MADPKPTKPDIKTFLSDPAHQEDREFLEAVFENYLTRKAEEAEKRRKEAEANEPTHILDRFFGGR